MKKVLALVLLLAVIVLAGCQGAEGGGSSATQIILKGDSAEIKGGGAKAEGGVVTISAVGSYSVSGKLEKGQIVVDTGDDAMEVTLILNNAEIINPDGPAIHVVQAKDLNLELADGSVNTVVSGTEAPLGQVDESASGAAIYAEDDMDIRCSGSAELHVYGYISNGIACKNDLDIEGGSISVYAVNNGVRGSDSFEMKGGELSVQAGNDGIKSTTADKDGKGYVSIQGGDISVRALGDGISAETELSISGGSISILTEGDPDADSCKGLKANTALHVDGGALAVNSADHALHCEGGIEINGGTVSLLSNAGKGISSEALVKINGGAIGINSSGDGVETTGDVHVAGGLLTVVSASDGIQTGAANSGKGDVSVTGGTVCVNAKKAAFNVRGGFDYESGVVLGFAGEDKLGNAQYSVPWSGIKGSIFSLKQKGEVLAEMEVGQAFEYVTVFCGGEGLSLSDGLKNLDLN